MVPALRQRSLKARALELLAQRDQSRAELRRKLLVLARAEDASAASPERGVEAPQPSLEPAARVDSLLDWLAAHRYLCDERFADSRVHARAPRFGNLRIRHELRQHGVVLPAATAQALSDSEIDRARAVRAQKFPLPADGLSELARQARFLIGRGFSAEVVRRVLRAPPPDDP